MSSRRIATLALTLLLLGGSAHDAGALVITLGDQDFNDGDLVNALDFENASVGEPAPFAQIIGSDFALDFSASWTFSYATQPVGAATLTLGLLDSDAQATGSQVASFLVDGTDVTGLLDAALETGIGAQGEYSVLALSLPESVLGDLTDGTVTFSLTLQGPGLAGLDGDTFPGDAFLTEFNGAGLDFASLEIRPVPEPGAATLFGVGALLAARSCRRVRRAGS
jgi:hypothetical protein